MLTNYLKTAIRHLLRHRLYAFINIVGLAVGMACCILIMLWVLDELGYDRFHVNADRICQVVREDHNQTPGLLGPAVVAQYPEITHATRMLWRQWKLSHGRKFFSERGVLVDPSFFEVFSFPLVNGRTHTALAHPSAIVISERLAQKLFAGEDPVGQTITAFNNLELTVTGVMRNVPRQTHFLSFDWVIPFDIILSLGWNLDWETFDFRTYVMLQDGVPVDEVSAKIADIIPRHAPGSSEQVHLQPLREIRLYGMNGDGTIVFVWIFSTTAMFLLLIACMNFMNLATARASVRAREVGMRKVVGAQRSALIAQFLGEALLSSGAALVLALAFVELALPAFGALAGKELVMDYRGDWRVDLGLIGVALVTGALAGSYPALVLSSFQPVKVLKGSLRAGSRSAAFRRSLVVTQFVLSTALIICTLVLRDQLAYIQSKDLGYDKSHILCMELTNDLGPHYGTLRDRLMRDPRVLGVTATNTLLDESESARDDWDWEGKATDEQLSFNIMSVLFDFLDVFGMEMAEGQFFSAALYSGAESGRIACVVNEAAVKAMGMDSPIGKYLQSDGIAGHIIGVIKDFHYRPLHYEIQPLVLCVIPQWLDNLCIKIAADDVANSIGFIERTVREVAPEYPFEYRFLDEEIDKRYRAEQRMGTVFDCATVVAIAISCLGLLGLASFTAEQRTKEIGIRKALGASVAGLVGLLSREFALLVLLANVVAWPVSYYAMRRLLGFYAYQTGIRWEIFVLAGLLAFFVALATVSYQALRAALADPVEALRYE